MTRRPSQRTGAFTLLEVMVAIAILAVSLTAIFSSEAGAIKMAHRARKLGIATLLARCKMGEIEQQVAEEGLPAVFDSGSDGCCDEGETEGFECEWEMAPVVLPETMFAGEEGEEGEGADPLSKMGAAMGIDPTNPQAAASAASNVDPTQLLAGGGTGGLASMALSYVYPVLKPSFESQIRRATVTVRWKEGDVGHEFDVTQYLVADQPVAQLDPNALQGQGAAGPLGIPGGSQGP